MATAFVVGLSIVMGAAGLAAVAGDPPKGAAAQRAAADAFVRSLSDAERAKALRPLEHSERIKWCFARGDRDGLFLRDMDADTRAATLALVDKLLAVHAGVLEEGVADAPLREWRTRHAGELAFAFVGETDLREPHDDRLATPCFTIEYDSTNADASHVHCVWSDPANNFGGDALRAHLKREHAAER